MTDPSALRSKLAAAVPVDDPAWRTALETVPRELFIGDGLSPIRRDPLEPRPPGPDRPRRVAAPRLPGYHLGDPGRRHQRRRGPRARGRAPHLVQHPAIPIVRMLDLAHIREGDRVLEIGTGTGYSTAILCARLGDKNMYSIEYDPYFSVTAADHIHAAGYHPTLITGDGLAGHKDGAEYDAIVATCAVRHIPPGLALPGTRRRNHHHHHQRMDAGLRPHPPDRPRRRHRHRSLQHCPDQLHACPHERLPRPTFYQHPGQRRPSRVNPALLEDWTGHFLAQLAAPSAELMTTSRSVLVDVATGSQAWTEPAGDGWTVH